MLKALKIDVEYSKAHHLIAIIYEISANIKLAKKHYWESIKYFTENALSHFRLGLILSKEGEIKEAEEHLKKAVSIEPPT